MNILVTGGAGFIGSNFLTYIHQRHPSWKLINLDDLTYAGNLSNIKISDANYRFVKGNINNKNLVSDILKREKIDVVVNFAAETHVDRSISSSIAFLDTNVSGTVALLDVIKTMPEIHFIHISTDEVYGSIESGIAKETAILNPSSPYSASKAAGEHFIQAYQKTFGIRFNIIRASNNYGPRQNPEKFIPLLITRILNHQSLPIYGTGENIRNWLYVDDFCRGIETVILKGNIGEIYNIGGQDECSNIQLVTDICSIMKYPLTNIEYVEDRKGHDFRYGIDSSKIQQLGWKPKTSFEEGIKQTVEWYVGR